MKYPPELLATVTGHFNSKGQFIMEHRKTHDQIKALKAHNHKKADGGIDQAAVCRTIDELNALAKAGKTKTTFFQQGEWMDEKGNVGFEGIIRGIPVSD